MDALSQFFTVLALLYAVECVRWTPRSTLVLRALAVRNFRRARFSPLFGSPRAGLIWLQPLPPLGTALLVEAWPVAPSPKGLATREPLELELAQRAPFQAQALAWEQVEQLGARENVLVVNGREFARCGSNRAARELAQTLEELRVAREAERAGLVRRALARAFDGGELRTRVERFFALTRGLRALCNAQFVVLAVATPVAVYTWGTLWSWAPLAAAVVGLNVAITVKARRAARELTPDCSDELQRLTLACALSPISALRALDEVARPLVADLHPLSAAALAPAPDRAEIERLVAVDALHPRRVEGVDPLARECERWFSAEIVAAAARAGHDLRAAAAPPAPEDAQMRGYCPRCQRQFPGGHEVCFDCTTSIEPLSAAPESAART